VIRQAWIDPPLTTLQPFVEQVFRIFSVPVFSFERRLPFSCPMKLATRLENIQASQRAFLI
jgi:hypothetical protein